MHLPFPIYLAVGTVHTSRQQLSKSQFSFSAFSPGKRRSGTILRWIESKWGRKKKRKRRKRREIWETTGSSSSSEKKIYKVGHLENMASFFTPFFARRKFRKNLCCLFLFHNLIVRETSKKTEEEQLVLCLSTCHWRNRRKSRDSPRFTRMREANEKPDISKKNTCRKNLYYR